MKKRNLINTLVLCSSVLLAISCSSNFDSKKAERSDPSIEILEKLYSQMEKSNQLSQEAQSQLLAAYKRAYGTQRGDIENEVDALEEEDTSSSSEGAGDTSDSVNEQSSAEPSEDVLSSGEEVALNQGENDEQEISNENGNALAEAQAEHEFIGDQSSAESDQTQVDEILGSDLQGEIASSISQLNPPPIVEQSLMRLERVQDELGTFLQVSLYSSDVNGYKTAKVYIKDLLKNSQTVSFNYKGIKLNNLRVTMYCASGSDILCESVTMLTEEDVLSNRTNFRFSAFKYNASVEVAGYQLVSDSDLNTDEEAAVIGENLGKALDLHPPVSVEENSSSEPEEVILDEAETTEVTPQLTNDYIINRGIWVRDELSNNNEVQQKIRSGELTAEAASQMLRDAYDASPDR